MPPMAGRAHCWAHDPKNGEARDAARRRGGRRRHRGAAREGTSGAVSLRTVSDIQAMLERAASEAMELANSNARNRVVATIAQVALRATEVGELAHRLQSLEERLKAREQRELTTWQSRGIG